MKNLPTGSAAVFVGSRRVAHGHIAAVARAAHRRREEQPLIFDGAGRIVDVDLRGSVEDVLARLSAPSTPPKPGRGRPKLGVVAREVTLLPRHWEWLAAQPGGASATLRRLVDEARRESADEDRRRQITEAAYRVATTLAGDQPGYEEAIRALFAGDATAFYQRISAWPPDVADYLRDLTAPLSPPS